MVYDPIRDCEVPSPATSVAAAQPWREHTTPGSEGHHGYQPNHSVRGYENNHPPAFHPGQQSPLPSRSTSGGGLRGLLNHEEPRRSSEQRSSISSTTTTTRPDVEDYSSHPVQPIAQRPSIHNMLHMAPGGQPISESNSSSSMARSSSSNASPVGRHTYLDANNMLTPATPADRSSTRYSKSPHPPHHDGMGSHTSPYPQYPPSYPYQVENSGPSSRRTSVSGPRPMLPPQDIPQHMDYRTTPTAGHLPLRSPSVSVSPRGYQASLPPGYPTSRPGSSSASQSFGFHHTALASPSYPDRRLSEDRSRPPSAGSQASRRGTVHQRRDSQIVPVYSPGIALNSPSPGPPALPYEPKRLSKPTSLYRPISAEEVEKYRSIGMANNPLRRRKRKPLPSWSGNTSKLPNEGDSSYFPPQDERSARAGSQSTAGRASATPGPAYDRASGTPVDSRVVSGGQRHASTQPDGKQLKRGLEQEDVPHDTSRRKVSKSGYVSTNATAVAEHYNSRPNIGVEHRELSPIIGLKKFNNWIKSVLIGKFAHRGRDRPGANILDIGCGKGGDLNKWKQARIRLYVGLDIAETSISQATERYQKMHRPGFDAFFFAYDCFSNSLKDILPQDLAHRDLYDNVTMQFCMHYAFETASKARMMMENVSRYLRPGGVFIGTIPDSQLLLNKLAEVPEDEQSLRFGNDCYFVEFAEREHKSLYGHQYRFFLEDAVGDVPEYIVHWDNFVNLAAEYNLRLIYQKPFSDILQEEQSSRDFGPLLGKMGVVNSEGESAMDAHQWEAANLYMAFAFEKVSR